jgi:hypothetical protein
MRKALICGCYRSGTTILGEMLDAHSEVCCSNELGSYCVGEGILRWQLRNKLATTEAFLAVIQSAGKPWYVDKHPLYTGLLPHACQYVEKIICCLRHPLEIIESMLRNWKPGIDPVAVPWVFSSPELCINPPNKLPSWFDLMNQWESWKASPTCPYLEVHYDDMGTSAGRIADFLGIDGDELEGIFSSRYNHRSFQLPAVELPQEWLDLIGRLGLG